MSLDPVVDEVRQARDAYARRFNYDLQAIYLDLKEKEKASGRLLVTLPPRRIPSPESPTLAAPSSGNDTP